MLSCVSVSMCFETGVDKYGSLSRYKRKDEWNESYGEKNRGPAYMSRFVTLALNSKNKEK